MYILMPDFELPTFTLEQTLSVELRASVIESRRSYMYGLCEVAVRLDCLYQSEDRTIQYYLIRYNNKYSFKTEEVKNGLKIRVSGELMNYIVVVNTNSSDDLDLIIQEVGVNNT